MGREREMEGERGTKIETDIGVRHREGHGKKREREILRERDEERGREKEMMGRK